MNKWPLRIKITVLVGMVATLGCLILTANSIFSARSYYSVLNGDSLQTEKTTDEETTHLEVPPGEIPFDDSLSPYHEATRQFSFQSLLVMLGVILLSVVLTYYLAGQLLRPLTSLTDSIRAIDQGRLQHRVELPKATGEVLQLTVSFNSMMERLEESFEIQKNFSANAAHELKTPLALIKTSLQVLEMEEEPSLDDYREFTKAAKISIERLTGTVDALMSLTKGAEEQAWTHVELAPLFKLIFSELQGRADASGVSLNMFGTCKAVNADRTLLYRLFFNLVENAVKYNKKGGEVTVTLSQRNGRSVIEVADTGIGMSKEELAHVFEPFYRADKSRSQKIPGSGLGLSVVKTVIERCYGQISIQSEEGAGTTVTIVL